MLSITPLKAPPKMRSGSTAATTITTTKPTTKPPFNNQTLTPKSVLTFLLLLTAPYMLWKLLCLITGSSIPMMVVISESMAPAFHRGDIIFLWNRSKLVNVGDIPVVWFKSQPLPMVHRAVQVFGEGVVYVSSSFPSLYSHFGWVLVLVIMEKLIG